MLTAHIALVVLVSALAGDAQQAPQRAAEIAKEGVRAVLVDIVVRDRRGQPVRDLTQGDIEVFEDGVPQAIGSFTPVIDGARPATGAAAEAAPTAAAAGTPSSAAAGAPAATGSDPAVLAVVFDRLTPESRRLAIQAAQSYLGDQAETSAYVGIFGIDLSLATYAPFTRNGRLLRQALAGIAGRASSGFNNAESQQQKRDASQRGSAAAQAAAGAQAAGGPGTTAAVGSAPATAKLAEMESQMITDFELMERDQQGYATTNGLSAIVSALGRVSGRKSLVLFSEGVAIPPAVQRLFLGVIDAANRANVSIYTMDAAGLRAESEQGKIRDQVNQAAGGGINTGYAAGGGSEPLTKMLEKNEDVLRQDPHNALGELARGTGGLLFENSNNLRQGFARIQEDLRNYYLVGYTPSNNKFDGRFRTINVKVRRPGVSVAARSGYFAVRDTGGMPVNDWEAPALGALEQKPVPNAFPVRAAGLLFPEADRPGLVPVVVDLPTAPLTFQAEPDGETYSSDFAVLVRFLDQQNKVARKVSQHYQVRGPITGIDLARQGQIIFYREPELPPGLYTMETVVYDSPSGKSSVRFSSVEVPPSADGKLRMSSLVIVKRSEKVPEKDRPLGNPLLVDDLVLHPNLGESISKASKEVGFYFAAYLNRSGTAAEAALELSLNGAVLANLPLSLGKPDAAGRVQQVGRLPLDQLAPGTYELRAAVKQGADQVSRSTLLRITE